MFLRSLLGWRYRGLSAGKLKWCPLCWREQENNGEDIRGLLSWTVDINTACSKHKIDLVTRCPDCDRENPVISASSEFGVCIHCGSSLHKEDAAISSSCSSEAVWVAQAIDDLIASRKELSSIDLAQRWRHFIARVADKYSSEKEAERTLGLSITLFRRWRSRNRPNFPELMHFLYKTENFPSRALLSSEFPHLFVGVESERKHPVYVHKSNQIDKHKLARCLKESDLSVHGLARLLHVSEGNLRHRLPLLVNRIAGGYTENSLLYRKQREEELFEFALKLIEKAEQNDQELTNEQLRNLCRHLPGFKRLSQRSIRKYLSKKSKERKKLK